MLRLLETRTIISLVCILAGGFACRERCIFDILFVWVGLLLKAVVFHYHCLPRDILSALPVWIVGRCIKLAIDTGNR